MMQQRTRSNLTGLALIAPNFILMAAFVGIPVLFSMILAFTDWDLVSGLGKIRFVGLANFTTMLSDIWFKRSFMNTLVYTIVVVPGSLAVSVLLAVTIQDFVWRPGEFRLVLFLPHISNIVAVSIIWSILYSQYGPLAEGLRSLGIDSPPNFLGDPRWAMPSIMLMSIWTSVGYCVLIFSAGLQNIPRELYEAAMTDGAGYISRFFHVTIPCLSATTFFLTITQVIASFKVFAQIQIMTEGGPLGSTSVLAYYVYETAFRFYKFGYASAVALVLFLIILAFSVIQWRRQYGYNR